MNMNIVYTSKYSMSKVRKLREKHCNIKSSCEAIKQIHMANEIIEAVMKKIADVQH